MLENKLINIHMTKYSTAYRKSRYC